MLRVYLNQTYLWGLLSIKYDWVYQPLFLNLLIWTIQMQYTRIIKLHVFSSAIVVVIILFSFCSVSDFSYHFAIGKVILNNFRNNN